MRMKLTLCLILLTLVVVADAQPQNAPAGLTGNAERGKTHFNVTYKCYACHGFDGQTGSPRLVPMGRTQEAFIAYVQKPTAAQMPAYADAPAQNLADVYAYIRSLKQDAQPVEKIRLLSETLKRIQARD